MYLKQIPNSIIFATGGSNYEKVLAVGAEPNAKSHPENECIYVQIGQFDEVCMGLSNVTNELCQKAVEYVSARTPVTPRDAKICQRIKAALLKRLNWKP